MNGLGETRDSAPYTCVVGGRGNTRKVEKQIGTRRQRLGNNIITPTPTIYVSRRFFFLPNIIHTYVQYNNLAICGRTKRNTNIVTMRTLFDSTLLSVHTRPRQQLRRRRRRRHGILFNFNTLKFFFPLFTERREYERQINYVRSVRNLCDEQWKSRARATPDVAPGVGRVKD